MEVIERGPGPELPLLAIGLLRPPSLKGGRFVRGRESHRGAVILVLCLLLFCELEEHRVGTGLDSMASPPGVQWQEGVVVQGHHRDFSHPRAQLISEPINPLLPLRKQNPLMHHHYARPVCTQIWPTIPEIPTSQLLGEEVNCF